MADSLEWAKTPLETPIIPPNVALRNEVLAGNVATSTLRDFARLEAISRQVDPDLFEAIINAESGFVWDAENNSSTASGLLQYLDGTFYHYCSTDMTKKNDPVTQIDCALTMIADGGLHHWNASRSHWAHALPSSGG